MAKRSLFYILALLLGLNWSASATTDNPEEEGLWFFGGLGGGYATVSSSASVKSTSGSNGTFKELSSKSGWDAFGKGSLSFYTQKWATDFGFGYSMQQFKYKNLDPDPIAKGNAATTSKVNLTMTLRNLYFELSPRYRLNESFQAGPYLQLHYGSDVGHSESPAASTKSLIYYGAHLNYDRPINLNWIMRLGLQAYMDFNETSRSAMQLNGLIEFGVALGGERKEPRREAVEEVPPPPQEEFKDDSLIAEEVAPPPLPIIEEAPPMPQVKETGFQQILVTLPSDKFLFDTGMSHIRNKETRAYLGEYGDILSQNKSQWKKLEITGHTDKRGTRKVNRVLSKARAKTVYDILAKAGVPKNKMTYKGFAFDKPVDRRGTPAALAKNRRVEMQFTGVKATQDMVKDIEELNGRYGFKSGSGKY